jgi:heme exporter protein CcmD
MNSHTSYIILSYAFGTLVLGWTALSPVLKKRRVFAQLEQIKKGIGQGNSD